MPKIALPRPRILYTEDTMIHAERMIPMMERLLNAQVTHLTDNGDAERRFIDGERYNLYVLDDSAGGRGEGHGLQLSLDIAKKLNEEGRGGIVIAANSSNSEILRPGEEYPFSLDKLHEQQVEYWYKFTEGFKMICWMGECIKQNKYISRVDWLTSVGEETLYDTYGSGNNVERMLSFCAMDATSIQKIPRGALYTNDIPSLISFMRIEKSDDNSLNL